MKSMQIKFLIFSLSMVITHAAWGQDQAKYNVLVGEAFKLYEAGDYLKSAQKYSEAFAVLGNKGSATDRYNAACSWALAGKADSAFVQLFKAAKAGKYSNYNHLSKDADLSSLYADPRWKEILALVKANKTAEEANLDKGLLAILDSIYTDDQSYRLKSDAISQKHGYQSAEMTALWDTIQVKDSINLIKVTKILDERGWLGPDVVGRQGSATLFLVIQHADIKTQEKYLPMMRDAVKKGNANAANLALLEDRVLLRQGKRQIYGSQIGMMPGTEKHYVLPLEDPDHVDERRAAVGLGKLQDYVSHWNIVWDVEAYKKQLPELEKKQKP